MARSKQITALQRKRGIALWKACDQAHAAIFQGANNTPWNEAYRIAAADLRNAYDDASRALREYERQLVNEGRGYINAHGHFVENGTAFSPWI